MTLTGENLMLELMGLPIGETYKHRIEGNYNYSVYERTVGGWIVRRFAHYKADGAYPREIDAWKCIGTVFVPEPLVRGEGVT